MNILRQNLETVLFILSPLEVLHPFPVPSYPTILSATKGEPVTFAGSFCPFLEGLPFTEGDGAGDTF